MVLALAGCLLLLLQRHAYTYQRLDHLEKRQLDSKRKWNYRDYQGFRAALAGARELEADKIAEDERKAEAARAA